jgi:hypothetical protein
MPQSDTPFVTRLFQQLPGSIQDGIREVLQRSDLLLLLRFYFGADNILREKGWFDSERKAIPVDAEGDPTPWYTYSMIDFLQDRLTDNLRVFEYGGGYSTIWYSKRVDTVVAVDDSEEWVEIVTPKCPRTAKIVYEPSRDGYVSEVLEHSTFDIVVIDGSHRTNCVDPAVEALSDQGVIIWDDFERLDESEYEPLAEAGFSVLPFHGLKALGANYKCTAVFYRDENCLGI